MGAFPKEQAPASVKRFARCTGFLLLVFVLFACGDPDPPWVEQEDPERPNVLLVLTDDQPPAAFQEMPRTQEVLVNEGMVFRNAIISDPICCPSRATILTGKYSHNHGVLTNTAPAGGAQKFREGGRDEDTIATRLSAAGYRTGYFGKYLNGMGGTYVPPGWDRWFGFIGDINEEESYEVNSEGEIHAFDRDEHNETDLVRDRARAFVENNASAPWFAVVAPHAPHGPYFPPERHRHDYDNVRLPKPPSFDEEDVSDKPREVREAPRLSDEDRARFRKDHEGKLETLRAVDDLVGALVGTLDRTGQLDRTYLVFMTDNGYLLGEHRLESKLVPYEESIRTSFAVRGPGVPAGVTNTHLVANTDVAPTFADLAGAEPPADADGRSLVPLLTADPPDPEDWRQALLLEAYTGAGEPRWKGIRTSRYTYVQWETGEKELYDNLSDPYQLENMYASAEPSLVKGLRDRLEALEDCSGEGCQTAEDRPLGFAGG
jgi:N-acetylglucosamine-6-sulfatase